VKTSDFMKDYDHLLSGSIGFDKLCNCLVELKINLTQQEENMIYTCFKNPRREGEILWQDFCNLVDKGFVVSKLNKKDAYFFKRKKSTKKAPERMEFNWSDEEIEDLTDTYTMDQQATNRAELKNALKTLIVKERIRLQEYFSSFDPLDFGILTFSKFKSAMENAK
jgi:hypothetical protein